MKLRGEMWTIVLVFAVPAILLFPWVNVSTSFTASLETKSIQFTTAPWEESAGLFNSDQTALDLTVVDFDRIESREPSDRATLKGGGPVTLRRVLFHSLDVNRPLRVQLDAAEDGALSMRVERQGGPETDALATFRSDTASDLPDGLPRAQGTRSCEWAIYGKRNRLHLTLRPWKDKIRPESRIPLLDGSAVAFEGGGQSLIGGPPDAQLMVLDRKLRLEGQSLRIGRLKRAWIESLEPGPQRIKVLIARARSSDLQLNDTNQAATLAEYLTSHKPLATYLSMVALIGSTALTILTRLRLIRSRK